MPLRLNKVLGIALAPVLLTGALVAAPPALASTQVSFTAPGLSSWTVPDDVTEVTITAIGGAGGAGLQSLGGASCTVTNVYPVEPGEVFRIFVGGGGGGGYDNVSPSSGPNDGGDGCGSFTSGGNGLSPNGQGGSNAVGGGGGGGDPTTNGSSGLAGAGGIGFGNPGSGGIGDVCSFGDGGTTISFGGGGGGGGYGGGGAGSQLTIGGQGTFYGGGGGGGSTGPSGATFSIDTARTANSLTGRNGSVLISFGPPDTAPSWFQSYARGASVSCLAGWNPSWAQWPGNGTGGYVCNREIYMTPVGTWSSRSQLLGSVVEQSTPAPAHSPARPVISYRC